MSLFMLLLGCLKWAPPELAPYERAELMTPAMQDPADPAQQHVFGTRESLVGADGGAGAACGCE